MLAVAVGLLGAAPALSSPQTAAKQAEAQRVLTEIQQIDVGLEKVIEAYNAAQSKLQAIEAEQRTNERHLEIARQNYRRAQTSLAQRLVSIYTSGDESAIEVVLGATSLTELVDRLDAVSRVSEQDRRVVREIVTFRAEIKRREAALAKAHAAQEQLVAAQAAKKQEIERQLAQRKQLLATIKSQIAQIEAAEAARQQKLAAQAQERLADSQPSGGGGGSSSGGGGGVGSTPDGAGGSPPPSTHGGVVSVAMRYLGVPYVWGGASPSGFDCSGFTMYVYAQVGVSLPHNAAAQYSMGTPVSRASLQPGDLVFFGGLGHVGLYIGGGQFIHSPHSGSYVKIDSITGWYASTYVGARRY